MAVHIRNNFSDFFLDMLAGIDEVYHQSKDFDETNAAYKKLFAQRSSERSFENRTGVSGFGTFNNVGEMEDVPLMNTAQLYDKKFTHLKWAGAWQVSEEMTDDDNFEIVSGFARAFARSMRFTKEVDLANVFNNSLASERSADGSLIGATHTLYSGSTIANNVAADFGVSAAQAMFNYYATLTDDRGLRIRLKPKYIVANPAMRWVIEETMKSSQKPFTATNEINELSNEDLTSIYWAEIADTDAWYASADPNDLNGNGLVLYNRQDFTTSRDFDVRNLSAISVGRARWSRGCTDWRQLYISAGA
jgi:hypothetical protein